MLTQRFTCNDHYSMAVKYMPAKSYYYAQVGTAGIKIGRRWRPQNRKNMVGRVGIEPTTIGLKDRCSTTELPAHVSILYLSSCVLQL